MAIINLSYRWSSYSVGNNIPSTTSNAEVGMMRYNNEDDSGDPDGTTGPVLQDPWIENDGKESTRICISIR